MQSCAELHGKTFKEELLRSFSGLLRQLLGDAVFLWGRNLLAHFINAYLVGDSFSQAPAICSYPSGGGDGSEHADLPFLWTQ